MNVLVAYSSLVGWVSDRPVLRREGGVYGVMFLALIIQSLAYSNVLLPLVLLLGTTGMTAFVYSNVLLLFGAFSRYYRHNSVCYDCYD